MSAPLQDFMPVLSPGKHRSPKRGACFMEMASYLAGERWSDNPACTHPLLSAMARLVNDNTTDAGRSRLVPLIPSVIGLNGDGARWYAVIARSAGIAAFPYAPAERQNALAVGLLTTEYVLARIEERPTESISDLTRDALATAPLAASWARRFWAGSDITPTAYVTRSAPSILRFAVHGIVSSTHPDPDLLLHNLLNDTIEICRGLLPESSHHDRSKINYGRNLSTVP